MVLSEEQKDLIRQWVKDGFDISDIQKKLSDECGVSITYIDLRILIIELGVELQNKPEEKFSGTDSVVPDLGEPPGPGELTAAGKSASAPSGSATSSVELDRVTKPGSIVSGTVTFSDGVHASWALDQFGRLTLDAGKPGYTPSQQDVQAFQQELKQALAKRGF